MANDALRQALGELMRFAQQNADKLSSTSKMQLLELVQAVGPRLVQAPALPEAARLLWQMAGGEPSVFVNYLRQYPNSATQALAQNPATIAATIEQLQNQDPQAEPQVSDGIQESDINSSNVWGMKYDPKSQRMYVKFNGKDVKSQGPVYAYEGVPGSIAKIAQMGAVPAKTTGSNKWSSWFKTKNPSMGSAVNALLKNGPYAYQKLT